MILVRLTIWGLVSLASAAYAQADMKCRTEAIKTDVGLLEHVICRDAQRHHIHTITYEKQSLLQTDFLGEEANNKARSIWVYSSKALAETGCPDRLYLIDLSTKPVKVIAFGVKKACNEFHWASWGEKRSVIALKNNVSFIYENGKVRPPASGEKLWKSIEPPHAGSGLAQEDAVGFAEDVPLPMQ